MKIIEVLVKIPAWIERPLVLVVLLYRRARFGYAFRRIALSRGKYAIVDPEDFQRLSNYKWYVTKSRNTFYATRTVKRQKGQRQKYYPMHRQIIHIPTGMVCDHINGDGLDNRKANLRAVTAAQNIWNTGKSKAKSHSKFKGLAWDKKDKRWEVRITVNGQRIYIGRFKDQIEAAKAYDKAAIKYHGQYAGINFINRGCDRDKHCIAIHCRRSLQNILIPIKFAFKLLAQIILNW